MEQLDSVIQDVRLAMRTLAREKAWTAVAILTLALGIGANSTLFTIVNDVLLRPLPYPHAERIISISESDKGVDRGVVEGPMLSAWQRSARSFSALAVYSSTDAVVDEPGGPTSVDGLAVTAGYFDVIGLAPLRGRVFTEDEDRAGGPSLVLLSEQLWRGAFGGDPTLVGRTVRLDDKPYAVIGIMPAAFTSTHRAQYWTPLRMQAPGPGETDYWFVLGHLRPSVSIAAARAELEMIRHNVEPQLSADQRGLASVVMTLHDRRFGDTRRPLLILLGAVGVLLLIACANVSNLLLARATARRREFAVRVALGASRWRLVRYLLTESVALSLAGGALGLLIPFLAVGYFVHMSPGSVAHVDGIGVDGTVLAFTFGIAVLTGMLFGLLPALDAGRVDLRQALASATDRTTGTPRQRRLRRLLVVSELATALILLTGAGLLLRSFARVTSIDPGLRADHLLLASTELPRSRYSSDASRAFFNTLLERTRALPGVRSAALANAPPLSGANVDIVHRDKTGKPSPGIHISTVGAGYFETVAARIVAGRSFTADDDRPDTPPAVVVNETMARLLYGGGRAAVGHVVDWLPGHGGKGARIVGVVADLRQSGIEHSVIPEVFFATAQNAPGPWMTLIVRTVGDPVSLEKPIGQIVRALDAGQSVPAFTTMEAAMADAEAPRRFNVVLLGIFAALAATLAAVGLYGVMSYLVAARTREIGIRVALGAGRGSVVRLIVRQGMALILPGVVLGLAGSAAAVRVIRSLLYDVSIYDPWTFAGGAALLAAVALAACYLPARRAARVDPALALRGE